MATLRTLQEFYSWAAQQVPRVDLESRLRSRELFTSREITSFARFIRAKRKSGVVVIPFETIPNGGDYSVHSNNTFNTYWFRASAFVLWAARFLIPISTASKEYEALEKRFYSEVLVWTRSPQRYGLSEEEKSELFAFVHPEHFANPFNRPIRFRNHLIVNLVFGTGLRRGEICKLRLEDLHLRGSEHPYIEVRRRPNDRLDPRVNEPQVKTRERIIPIRTGLQDDLVAYLREHRGKGIRHPYLFTEPSNGRALNVGSINYIFSRVRKTNTRLANIDLTPHIGRHTFEGDLVDAAEKMGWQETKTDRVQKMISGWTETSDQPANYTARRIERDAFDLIRNLQEKDYRS